MVCPYCGGKLYKNKTVYSKLRQGLITYLQCKECRKTVQEVIPGRDKEEKVDVVLNDIHFPFQDDNVLTKVTSFIIDLKPDRIFLNGDIIDFFQISRFDDSIIRTNTIADDIQQARDYLEHFRINLPNTEIYYVFGNHEYWFARYIRANAPKLIGLKGMTLEEQLELKEKDIVPINSGLNESYFDTKEGLLIGHFYRARKHSASTGKSLVEDYGVSLIQAHVHRIGLFQKVLVNNVLSAWENGCLCQIPLHYSIHNNWAHCISVINWKNNQWHVTQVPIINGNFHYNGWN